MQRRRKALSAQRRPLGTCIVARQAQAEIRTEMASLVEGSGSGDRPVRSRRSRARRMQEGTREARHAQAANGGAISRSVIKERDNPF